MCCKTRRIILTQFDYANHIKPEGSKSRVGTTWWMAPEIILGEHYNQKVDVWSFGVLIREFLDGEPPYFKEQQMRVIYNIANNDPMESLKENLSGDLRSFIGRCLQKDPQLRATVDELLEDEWLNGAHSYEEEFFSQIARFTPLPFGEQRFSDSIASL